jgi:hypothetical protein
VLFLRIKRAQCALAGGRLDEAFALATPPDVRAHRQGQELAGNLAGELLKRGREHLAAGRLDEARLDCEKAGALAGNQVEVAELRNAVAEAIRLSRRDEQRKALALADARRQVARGQLSVGAGLLATAEGDTRAMVIQDVIDGKRLAGQKLAQQAEQAIERGDWDAAIGHVIEAANAGLRDPRIDSVAAKARSYLAQQAQTAMESGRLSTAAELLRRISGIGNGRLEVENLRKWLSACECTWQAITAGKFTQAREVLCRLKADLPQARWIEEALAQADAASHAVAELRCGPLSQLESPTLHYAPPTPVRSDPPPLPAAHAPAPAQPQRFLLQVDGVGAYLVLFKARVGVGPAGPELDLLLEGDPGAKTFQIERLDEDYFLRAPAGVLVNDRVVSSKLLADGDRIAPSRRSRLIFRLPSAASTSATLDCSGMRLPRRDVSRVILVDRELIIGPGASAHIRDDELAAPILLCAQEGGLAVRASVPAMAGERALDPRQPLPLGTHVRVGEAGLVITSV